jgi:NAD-dependent deacetylase
MSGQIGPSADVRRLAELVRESRSTVVLTGAGVSVPSGIPDFRTAESGLWANVDPMEVAHIDVFERDPERFWSYYRPRFHSLSDKRPNAAHTAIAELERRGLVEAVVTQNIDRLHRAAGSRAAAWRSSPRGRRPTTGTQS